MGQQRYSRLDTIPIDVLLPLVRQAHNKEIPYIKFMCGTNIALLNWRLAVYAFKGYVCVRCGLPGAYFALERFSPYDPWHVNLYASNNALMTVDHIVPKSHGGSNKLINLQCMCRRCNMKKGSHVPNIPQQEKLVRLKSSVVKKMMVQTEASAI